MHNGSWPKLLYHPKLVSSIKSLYCQSKVFRIPNSLSKVQSLRPEHSQNGSCTEIGFASRWWINLHVSTAIVQISGAAEQFTRQLICPSSASSTRLLKCHLMDPRTIMCHLRYSIWFRAVVMGSVALRMACNQKIPLNIESSRAPLRQCRLIVPNHPPTSTKRFWACDVMKYATSEWITARPLDYRFAIRVHTPQFNRMLLQLTPIAFLWILRHGFAWQL